MAVFFVHCKFLPPVCRDCYCTVSVVRLVSDVVVGYVASTWKGNTVYVAATIIIYF